MPSTSAAAPQRAVSGLRRRAAAAVDLYWGSGGVCDDVPALAWFLVAALVPLALGLTALASLVLGDYAQAQSAAERAARVLPAGVSDQVVQLILRTRRDSPLLLAFSIVVMAWTSAGAVGVIERSMSRQLGRERFGPVALKARHLTMALGVAALVVVMVLAGTMATDLQRRLGLGGSTGSKLLVALVGLGATTAICAGLYRYAPRDGVRWAAAARGAALAAVVLVATPTGVSVYLHWVAGTTPVRVFLVLTGVLAICYVVAIGLLVGAAIAVRREARG